MLELVIAERFAMALVLLNSYLQGAEPIIRSVGSYEKLD